MKKLYVLLLFIPVFVLSQQKLSLDEIWGKFAFSAKSAGGFNVMNNGLNYVVVDMDNATGVSTLSEYELLTGKKLKVLVNGNDVKFNNRLLDLSNYAFSPDEKKILLFENKEYVYRHSSKANYYVYDIASKQTIQVSEKGKQLFPSFSPDGTKIAYVRDNDLYIKDLGTNNEIAVTSDGSVNKIKNGWADWVYEEEFSKADYFEWSSNSKYLAYVKFDETKVRDYSMDIYKSELYPIKYTFKYPKAGEDNSVVSVHIYDLKSRKAVTADIGTDKDIYIPRIQFTNNPLVLCIQRMNRLQNKLEYLFTDVIGGKGVVALTDESKTYIDITDDLTFIGNKGFITSSERDEFNHLYYYDLNGKLITQITKGAWDVVEFKGFDEETNSLYYISTELGQINRDV
jgi:dipeptidyl-peptidase-4